MQSAGFESITSRFVFFWKQHCLQATITSRIWSISHKFSLSFDTTWIGVRPHFFFQLVQAAASERWISWCNKKEIRLCLHGASVYEAPINIFHLNLCQFQRSFLLWRQTWFSWVIIMFIAYTLDRSQLKVISNKQLFGVNEAWYKLLKTKCTFTCYSKSEGTFSLHETLKSFFVFLTKSNPFHFLHVIKQINNDVYQMALLYNIPAY